MFYLLLILKSTASFHYMPEEQRSNKKVQNLDTTLSDYKKMWPQQQLLNTKANPNRKKTNHRGLLQENSCRHKMPA